MRKAQQNVRIGEDSHQTRPPAFATGTGIALTISGSPWTVGTASIVTNTVTTPSDDGISTFMGFLHGPASATSTAGRVGGVVQLVTPVTVATSLPVSPVVAVFGILNLTLPEPGQFALTASAALGLALVAVGKRARRRG